MPSTRRVAQLGLAALGASLLLVPALTGASAEEACTAPAPVTVCVRLPAGRLSGDAPVSAVVSQQPGTPVVSRVQFTLGGAPLLTDFDAPYEFTLPTAYFADGSAALAARAWLGDGTSTESASLPVTFANGQAAAPANPNTWSPRGTPAPATGPYVVAATGDGADGSVSATKVADLVGSWSPNTFLYLGDVYEHGTRTEFHNWYGTPDRAFGRLRDITNPTVGNHEAVRDGYSFYWDNVPRHYSWDAGGWHFVSLDTTTTLGQVAPGTAQYEWLEHDLLSSSAPCTLVLAHHPAWSIGKHGDDPRLSAMWSLFAARGVDVVLNGHDHNYQRWKPLDGSGAVSENGPTQFVAGAGGHGVSRFARTDPRVATALDTDAATGALRFELHSDRADFRYVGIDGSTLDSGSVGCSGAPPAPPPDSALFADDFESGSLAGWSAVSGISASQAERFTGAWGARAASTGSATYARATLPEVRKEIYYRARVRLLSQAATSYACLLKVRSGSTTLVDLCVDVGGRLYSWNYVARTKASSSKRLLPGEPWREVQLRVVVDGAASATEVWLDGVRVPELSGPAALGTGLITNVQLGGNETGKTYDLAFDDVVVDRAYVGARSPGPSPSPSPSASPSPAASPTPSPSPSVSPSPSPSPSPTLSPTPSASLSPPPPPPGLLFADGFESGGLERWSAVSGMATSQSGPYAGAWSARATSTGGATYARKSVPLRGELYVGTRFRVASRAPASFACMLKVRTSSAAIVDVCVDVDGRLYSWNYAKRTKATSNVVVPAGGWHQLQLRAVVGAAGLTEVWYDGVRVEGLSGAADLGSTQIAGFQLGGNETGKTYDVAFDDVTAADRYIG